MKKVIFISIVVILVSMLSSCTNQPVPTTTTTKVTVVTGPGTDGFLLSEQVVVKGNTVWGISEKVYGSGLQWRDVVAQNPFLQAPNRTYYDDSRKMWIVRIYPGEHIKIGSQFVAPTYTYEESVTQGSQVNPVQYSYMNWWGLLAALVIAALIGWLIWLYRTRDNGNSNVNHITIGRTGFDQATNAAVVAAEVDRSYRFRERVAEHAFTNPNLTRATITENSNQANDFRIVTEYQVR